MALDLSREWRADNSLVNCDSYGHNYLPRYAQVTLLEIWWLGSRLSRCDPHKLNPVLHQEIKVHRLGLSKYLEVTRNA